MDRTGKVLPAYKKVARAPKPVVIETERQRQLAEASKLRVERADYL